MKIMRDTRFAIVISAYNAQKYLKEMYDSLLQQTYDNFIVITVDDCSTDITGEIADEYVSEFLKKKITAKVIHKEKNEGLSAARNTGMEYVIKEQNADYILFLDADDTVEPDLLESIDEMISNAGEEMDLIIYGFTEDYYDAEEKLTYSNAISRTSTINTKEKDGACDKNQFDFENNGIAAFAKELAELESQTLLGYAWNKAYRLDLLRENELRYEVITHVEDILFNINVLENAKTYAVVDKCLYHYRNANQTRLTAKYLPEYMDLQKRRVYRFIQLQENILQGEDMSDRAYEVMANVYFRSLQSMIVRMMDHGDEKKDIIKAVQAEYEDTNYVIKGKNLYQLLKNHLSNQGKMTRILYQPLADGEVNKAYRNAKIIGFVQKHFSKLYSKLKQNR
ncbi:MAG: glycosyltransferase [Lachnospiraceae bacterium]|nr:glycosyltransferase [Lachnospiraceae bacterium]